MPEETRDIGPDDGKRPDSLTRADQALGKVGTGQGYSGQEFDSAGQEEWRKAQQEHDAPADGAVVGSGAGAGGGEAGEDYDVGNPGGADPDVT